MRGANQGAVGFARALDRDGTDHTFSAVHVIEDKTRDLVAEHHPELVQTLPQDLERLLAPVATGSTFGDLGVTTAASADKGLHEAARSRPCRGMIVGRRAASSAHALVRLGRTTRRMLRHLDLPTIVVPPDYDGAAPLSGPVLLATDLGPATAGAARFAKTLAASLSVDILATTVVSVPGELGQYVPRVPGFGEQRSDLRQVRERLTGWIEAHALQDARSSVVVGPATAKLIEVAEVAGASVLVVGSRCLSVTDRVFASSLGSHLAALSPVPVAVVPPRWRP